MTPATLAALRACKADLGLRVHGILIGDLPLIVANAVTLVLAASILIAKIRFR